MPTLKVNFKSPTKATEFTKNFGVIGLKATAKVDGSVVVVTSKDEKTHGFVVQMVSDLKNEVKMESVISKFFFDIVEASTKSIIVEATLLDGSKVSIEPELATKFVKIHDSLCQDTGQGMLRALVVENTESYNKAMKFVAKEQE